LPTLVRRAAAAADAAEAARLLHDFNTEFDEFTPGVAALTERLEQILTEDDVTVLLGGEGPDGVAVLYLYPSVWREAPDAYLAELYVAPERRGEGIGRALLEEALDAARESGAKFIFLGTSEDDVAARGLYESAGFTNREGRPDGPIMFVYERDL
jgi:ribosomal protein S18 acetylase RimI-like enzyme